MASQIIEDITTKLTHVRASNPISSAHICCLKIGEIYMQKWAD